jgi:8-oxo-dGTP pyrophosphatase MutT (NUDIX family)
LEGELDAGIEQETAVVGLVNGVVRAAGGVVSRVSGDDGDGVEILMIHRPRYDDWTLPKGKAEPGEDDADCARREVEEETGLVCTLGRELPSVHYHDRHGRPKTVRYWEMEPIPGAGRAFEPNEEVDELRWVPLSGAYELLTYAHDDQVLAAFAEGRRSLRQ